MRKLGLFQGVVFFVASCVIWVVACSRSFLKEVSMDIEAFSVVKGSSGIDIILMWSPAFIMSAFLFRFVFLRISLGSVSLPRSSRSTMLITHTC